MVKNSKPQIKRKAYAPTSDNVNDFIGYPASKKKKVKSIVKKPKPNSTKSKINAKQKRPVFKKALTPKKDSGKSPKRRPSTWNLKEIKTLIRGIKKYGTSTKPLHALLPHRSASAV